MSYVLAASLALSVIGWSLAIYFWWKSRIIYRIAVQANFDKLVAQHRAELNQVLIDQFQELIQSVKRAKEEEADDADWWKN